MTLVAVNEKILEKVRKVLKKAQNNPSAEEAEACMLLAQRLMAENSLSIHEVDIPSIGDIEKEVTDITIMNKGRLMWWVKDLVRLIADNFRCKFYVRRSLYGNAQIRLLGLKEDVDIANELITYALKSMKFYSNQYVKDHKNSSFTVNQVRNSWYNGFLLGLKAKFQQQVKNNNWGLVLVRDQVVENAIEQLGLKTKKSYSSIQAGDGAAYRSGYHHGNTFERRAGALR
jgi:hypothetical protein